MGNTPSRSICSSNTDVAGQPQWAVTSNNSRLGSDNRNNDDKGSSGGSSVIVFRLPLYRGERNAFLPTDHTTNVIDYECTSTGVAPPPVLSVETNIPSVAEDDAPEISPLGDVVHDVTASRVTNVDETSVPQCRLHERTSIDSSPPTVISSSCDSSYGTCTSTLSSLQNFRRGNADSEQSNKSQSGWFHSVQQGRTQVNVSGYDMNQKSLTTNATQHTLPISHPKSILSSSSSGIGIFDCIKPQISATPPIPPPQPPGSGRDITRQNDVSTASLASLFESCIRGQEENDNEYINDDLSSGRGSYHDGCKFSKSIHQRSGSSGSVTSRASQNSRNSYYHNTRSNRNSKASLISAFSSTSHVSLYTEQEKNMVDGDEPTYESDLRRVRDYHVVTTAALPWMTGTAVNPLLRAAYLLRRNKKLQTERGNVEEVRKGQHETEINFARREIMSKPNTFEFCDDNSTFTQDGQDLQSPCSLDYSCFSASEFDFSGVHERCIISSLGDDEEEPLPMSLFQTNCVVDDEGRDWSSEPNAKTGQVTLVVPWLSKASERCKLYGTVYCSQQDETSRTMTKTKSLPIFATKNDQEAYIRSWLAEDAGMPEEASELNIIFYPARYHKYYNSIFALGDICDLISDESADVCILEEPEHLNWYRAPGCTSWREKFCHCVGIIHTNYKAYARDHAPAGFLAAPLLAGVNSLVVQANCHRVVKLSCVLQEFAPMSECVENIHGIRHAYLIEGERRRMSRTAIASSNKQRRAYFIGKLLWAKGFDQLLELEATFRERTGDHFEIDIFGSGPDESEIKRAFSGGGTSSEVSSRIFTRLNTCGSDSSSNKSIKRRGYLPVNFMGKADHLSLAGDDYSVFVNPSLTEVLCTTTAEAIAMGKWAVIPCHPSNSFFVQFPNCLSYRNRREFVSAFKYALINDPPSLSSELAELLSWEAATTRCVKSAAISKRDSARKERLFKAKAEKTLKKTLSELWNGDPRY